MKYDVVVVGAGSSSVFLAYELIVNKNFETSLKTYIQ